MWRCGKCLSQGGARPWEARSDVVAHGTERLVQLVFPDTQRSPDPYGGDLLPLGELADRRLRYAQVVRDLWHVHEAVGQVARFGCRGGGRSPYLRPGILAAFRIIIRYCMGCRERVASGGCCLSWDGKPPLVSHLVPSGCEKTQGVASSGRDKQRDTCWEACEAARGASCHVP